MDISILMSTFNEEPAQLIQAVNSILQQTYQFKELIIVLDNPNRQDLKDILVKFSQDDDRVKPIFNSLNIGLAQSLNKAAAAANSEVFARMDADDIAFPNRLEVEVARLQEYKLDVISANIVYIDNQGNEIGEKSAVPENSNVIANTLFFGSTIIHPTVLIRAEAFNRVGGYRPLPTAEDYDLWLRLLDSGAKIGAIDQTLLKYRIRDNSMTSNARKTFVVNNYIRLLCKQRRKYHSMRDDFSMVSMKNHFNKARLDDKLCEVHFNNGQQHFEKAMSEVKEHKFFASIFQILMCIFSGKENAKTVFNYLYFRLLLVINEVRYGVA